MEKSVTRYDTYSTRNMLPSVRVLIICAALAVAACSSNEPAPARESTPAPPSDVQVRAASAAPASTRPRIVFLGDSLTAGYGLDVEQSVPSLVQKHLDAEGYKYEVVNAGVSGDTSAGGLRRLEWSLDGNVRILVVELAWYLPIAFAGSELVRLGARVVRIERPGGEPLRSTAPAWDRALRAGKESVVCDLKSDIAFARALCARADVVLEGLRPGVADRLGIDPLIVRGALIVLLFVGGLGGLVYLIAWALLPDQNGKILAEAALHGDGWGIALLIVIGIALISNISDRCPGSE